jgi:aspartate carbamoyltransferase catalytic subunit
MNHLVTASQFDPKQLATLFELASEMQEMSQTSRGRSALMRRYHGRLVATLFYEPSTRTRLSFESAAYRLGMGVIGVENGTESSSAAKGESLEDGVRVVAGYADVIVLRHKENGAAMQAAAVSSVPVINAGDGAGGHPTQALLDIYTIQKEVGRLDGLNIVIGGDLKYGRTARSLAQILAQYPNNNIIFVSPPYLRVGDDIKHILRESQTTYIETDMLHESLAAADVVYWTRIQRERHDGTLQPVENYVIDQSKLDAMKRDAILLHPLPRTGEIVPVVDSDPRAAYFRQAENGLYVRMALLDWVLAKSAAHNHSKPSK